MCPDDVTEASEGLRELATWIVRDDIDSSHLDAYMRELLNDHLVELPAICRFEISVVARRCAGLTASEVARRLRDTAGSLERPGFSQSLTIAPQFHGQLSLASRGRGPDRGFRSPTSCDRCPTCRLSFLPEFIAGVVSFAVSIGLLIDWSRLSNFQVSIKSHLDGLELTAASGYLGLALLFAYEMVRQIRQRGGD